MTPALNGIIAGIVLVAATAAIAIPETMHNTIAGKARAVDGDTLVVGKTRVRLAEIDAPELAQPCTNSAGITWMCGQAARAAVQGMLARDPYLTCTVRDTDRYGRSVAVCKNSDGDIAGQLVASGLAIVYPRYSHGTYDDQQSAAHVAGFGMWGGKFVEPWEWRHEKDAR